MKKSYLIIGACAVGAFVLLRQSKGATASTPSTSATTTTPASGVSSALAALLGGLKGNGGTITATTGPYKVADNGATAPAPAPATAGTVAVVGGTMPTAAPTSGWGGSIAPTPEPSPIEWWDNTKPFKPGMLIHA